MAPMRRYVTAFLFALFATAPVLPHAQERLAPYAATPIEIVDRMLNLAGVGTDDVLYDLGSGDGRIVIRAAQRFGTRGVGVDIDARLVEQARENARKVKVDHLVEFRLQDAMTVDVSEATVVTLFLQSASNLKLRPILTRRLRPGARIVSHAFEMGDWKPDVEDTFRDAFGTNRTIFLWKADGVVRP